MTCLGVSPKTNSTRKGEKTVPIKNISVIGLGLMGTPPRHVADEGRIPGDGF